jgi:putative aldouronate transport system substrate-binding protein
MKKTLALLLCMAIIMSFATTSLAIESTPAKYKDVVEYSFLTCWNGGAASFPDGWEKSPLAAKLTEKTGVKLKVETITSSEREKLATIFASGDLPDITNAPYWSTDPGGEGELVKNAAIEGLLLPLKNLVAKYPNIKRMYEVGVISDVYKKKDVQHVDFKGETYVIPVQTPRTTGDVTNWAYNLFARKDILKKLNIKAESVTTTKAVYDLLKKVKKGNFKDTNGKPVIPGGTWHNGWSYGEFLRGFSNGITDWVKVNGKLVNDIYTQNAVDRVLFMRKLVAEGLMDPECFTQTDTMGKEKMITGRVAVFGCHYPNQYDFFKGTLYKDHPEMEFVPLGPILDKKGGVPSQVERLGRSGSPVLFLSKSIKDPERAMNFINYINSDEGLKLVSFGIEGQTYKTVNKIPQFTTEWLSAQTNDSNKFNLAGFGVGGSFIGADPRTGWGWNPNYTEKGYVAARKINPLKFIKYKTVDDVVNTWTGKRAYDEKMSTTNWGDELKKAYLAKTDTAAKAIIEAQRTRMKKAGYAAMEKFINDAVKKDPKILN